MTKKTTPKTLHLSVVDIVGDVYCVASADGKEVYKRLRPAIKRGDEVVLSFRGVKTLSGAFLGAAVAQLYGKFSEKEILKSLKIKDISEIGAKSLERVVDHTKLYHKDPKRYREAVEYAKEFM